MGERAELTVLTVTLKGVAAVEEASMVVTFLSEEPGILRRRPVLSGGDSADKTIFFNPKGFKKKTTQECLLSVEQDVF